MKSLHEKNLVWLSFYTLGLVLLSVSFLFDIDIRWILDELELKTIAAKSPYVIAAALIAIVATSIIPSNIKSILVFYRLRDPLPGTRIFGSPAQNDPRVDLGEIERIYGSLPKEPNEQNRLWYKLYQEVREVPFVNQSHGRFLLLRDMSILTVILPVIIIAVCILSAFTCQLNATYYGTIFVIYGFLTITACVAGQRFALNVLAEVSRGSD